jgi:hypothetical protein
MFKAAWKKPAAPFYPMPNTGTILDVSAGNWVKGHKGQMILNGGLAPFSCIAALPNMFKSTVAAGYGGAMLRAFPSSVMHVHDTETTIVQERVERIVRMAMGLPLPGFPVPESLIAKDRIFFTSSVDYNGTELFNVLKEYAKKRLKEEPRVQLELVDTGTGKPYEYFVPLLEFWDSLSGLKAESAVEMLEEGSVGTSELNMLAMRVNSGKSQIVEQAPDLTAKHGIYLLTTAHVGQQYQLDPRKPNIKTLNHLKGDVKLKRVPENLSFQTGNCYAITHYSQMQEKGVAEFPYEPGDETKQADLIELKLTNMRGKYGPSGIPLPIIVSQKEGWLPYMSNFIYLLREAGRYGLTGNVQNYALALVPDMTIRRTNVRKKLRESFAAQRAAQILMEMHWTFTYRTDIDESYHCEPEALYNEIKAMGYDWDLLLNTRFWHTTVEEGEKVPFLSTLDILRMRVGKYHPYWYPKSRKEMGLPDIIAD